MTGIAPPKEQITFEDLVKIDMRVGTIMEVSDIAESKKLVRLKSIWVSRPAPLSSA